MDGYKVHKSSTLTAFEFYEKFKNEEDDRIDSLFNESGVEEENGEIQKKDVQRPLMSVEDSISSPPESHEKLTKLFQERLRLRDDLRYVTAESQIQLVNVLITAIISVWPEHRKQVPDPFLSEIGNEELQRRVAVYVVHTVEELFYDYILKAEELNKKAVFSNEANISRLKTQLLNHANKKLNILLIRRKLAEEMRKLPNESWFRHQEWSNVSVISSANQTMGEMSDIIIQKSHKQFVQKQLSELRQITSSNVRANFPLMPSKGSTAIERHLVQEAVTPNTEIVQTSEKELVPGNRVEHEEEDAFILYKSDSMPNLYDDSELNEEFKDLDKLLMNNRRLSVNQLLVNVVDKEKNKCLTEQVSSPADDLAKLTVKVKTEEACTFQDDFSPLLQADGERTKKRIGVAKHLSNLDVDDNDSIASTISATDAPELTKENVTIDGSTYTQPSVINVKVPGKGIIRLYDVDVSNHINESVLTLHKYPTIYNEFLGEIDSETVKKLDQHLFAAEEIQDVYNEITKTMSQDHRQFDKDDYVENYAPLPDDVDHLFMSGMLQGKNGYQLINEKLKKEEIPPWSEFHSADEWRNEPKVSGVGREDILNLNLMQKDQSIPDHRRSTIISDRSFGNTGKLTKSYSAWLTWYKTNINMDDYLKFILKKKNDYLSQIFHLYESEDDMDESEEYVLQNSAELKQMKERQERREELRSKKQLYEEGYWNAQCVSLGGLGKDPKIEDLIEDESSTTINEKNSQNLSSYICLQERLDHVWKSLKVPEQMCVDMAIKYSSSDNIESLAEVIELWENVSEVIVEREGLMAKLETFERSASDPNRFFVKGPGGSSVARVNESKVRGKLNKQIKKLSEIISPMLDYLKSHFNDVGTYQGRNYALKMKSDCIEMLYWLQQERRKQALDMKKKNDAFPLTSIDVTSNSS